MDEVNGIDELLEKIEALRTSLSLNRELIPVFSDVLLFIKDIIPLMLEVNTFMHEGAHKVPTATDNLQNVTRTTEMATQEVMDRLESIIAQLDTLKKDILTNKDLTQNIKTIDAIKDETQQVFYSFQFQDITSQQLEYVSRILTAIYQKFVELFESSLRIKGNTLLGKGLIAAIERELAKNKASGLILKTNDHVRQNGISQDVIDKYFK